MRDLPSPTFPLSDLRVPSRRFSPLPGPPAAGARQTVRLEATWARHEEEVRQAQRLRYQVFVEEMGARPSRALGTPAGHEADLFDPFCEHLLVRAYVQGTDEPSVVGTYRLLTPEAAVRVGGFYSETEFDLTRLRPLRPKMVELGRSCVHPDWRHGGVILSLWGALTDFMQRNRWESMVGCASVSMRDGGHAAASLWQRLAQTHLAPIEWRVRPRLALPVAELGNGRPAEAPALIKGYLRCGAKVLGAPAWDPDFHTADLPLLMRMGDLPPRYRQHFMRAHGAG